MKNNYQELLNRIEWKIKRKEILNAHYFECQNCENSEIIKNSLSGRIVSIKRIRTALELFNKSDPRFNFEYELTYKCKTDVIFKQTIYANYHYSNEKLN